ncbi:MAG: hypothetical protein IKO80_02045 [Lachnospiraceae bacterium]|nr:hypothetical protein [Lachnospiraceae bacterium]
MKINMEDLNQGIRPDLQAGNAAAPSPLSSFALAKGAGAGSGRVQDVIAVDLTTSRFGSNAYAERRRGAAEIPGNDDQIDMAERNAMILLSNTLSGEDYAKAMEDGYQPGDTGVSESVTILDRIKTAMIRGGTEVAGFTDEIDRETLVAVTGSEATAAALEKSFAENDLPADEELFKEAADAVRQAESLQEPAGPAVKFLVENQMDPTIRNIYLAESATNGDNASAGGFYRQEGGYYARKADGADMDRLAGQIDAVVREAGFTPEEAGEEARWLISNDIPLTGETLRRVMELESVDFPVTATVAADAAAAALADGHPALDGNLADPVSLNRKAVELLKRQDLEEARLYMSAEVNRRLLDKGVRIDTLPMEELIDELKNARAEIAGELFPEDTAGAPQGMRTAEEKYTLFEASLAGVQTIRTAPAALIGEQTETVAAGTLQEIATLGESAAQRFARAESTYEAVGTQVRADLGDSISKAFRNVDEILRDLGMEENADNARAVRILGYNRMEISTQAVEEVRAADAKLRDVTDRLKPGAVLSLIRDGLNPLNMTLNELSDALGERGEQDDTPAEKYARFLMQLERHQEITGAERESYIGIYRLFRQLKKTDHAAIGTLLNEGAEMTIGNLLTANRSLKTAARGIDARVDDGFAGVNGGYKTPSISAQIESAFVYYSAQADSVYEHMDASALAEAAPTDATTLPELAAALEQSEGNVQIDRAVAQEQARSVREELSGPAAERAAEELEAFGVRLTPDSIGAMRALQQGRRRPGSVWNALSDLASRASSGDTLERAMDELTAAVSDGAQMEELYRDKTQEMKEALDEMMEETESVIDLQTMILAKKQLTVATALAERNSYDIPVEIDGRRVDLHVTLVSEEGTGSLMRASVPTSDHGMLTLSLAMGEEGLRGVLNTAEPERPDVEEYLTALRAHFLEGLRADTPVRDASDIKFVYRAGEGTQLSADPGESVGDDEMLFLAGAFVRAVAKTV